MSSTRKKLNRLFKAPSEASVEVFAPRDLDRAPREFDAEGHQVQTTPALQPHTEAPRTAATSRHETARSYATSRQERSEERRVGKEWRSQESTNQSNRRKEQ